MSLTQRKLIKSKRVSDIETLYAIVVFISLVWKYCTLVTGALSSPFMTFLIVGMWGLTWLLFSIKKNIIGIQLKICSPIIILFCIVGIRFLLSGNMMNSIFGDSRNSFFSPFNAFLVIYNVLISLLLGISAAYFCNKYKKLIIKLLLIVLLITPLPSIYYLSIDSEVVRTGNPNFYGLLGFDYVYSIIPFVGISILIAKNNNNSRNIRVFALLVAIVNSIFIVLSNFATATLLTFLTIFIAIIYNKKMTKKRIAIVLGLFVILFLLFRRVIGNLIISFAELDFFSQIMKIRLNHVAEFLLTGHMGSSFTDRIKLMNYSWQSFISYPIFGIPFSQIREGVLGFHETWVTLLGFSGLFGLICVLYGLVMFYKTIGRQNNCYFFNAYILFSLVLLMLSFLNPIFSTTNLYMFFCVVPMSSIFIQEPKRKKSRGNKSLYIKGSSAGIRV